MKKIFFITLLSFQFMISNAQEKTQNPFTFSGYIDTYYSYDFGKPSNHLKPSFFYNYNKHNEANINIALLNTSYIKNGTRANFGLMTGTYSQYNMATEQSLLKNIYQANIGVKISKTANLWIDAGIMPAHIGFESAIGKDCITLTRSIMAENSPYYETGVKLGYTSKSQKWYLAAMYLNGWQRIQKLEGNQTPAFGTQITYKPSEKATLNWSTYLGNEQPDIDKKWRYFNNFYGQFNLAKNIIFLTGFDFGIQQKATNSNQYHTWFSPIIIAQYKPTTKIQLATRGEFYSDPNQVIITTNTTNGFQTFGCSVNFDYLVTDAMMFRIEARSLNSKDAIFINNNNNSSNNNLVVTTALAMSF